MGIAQVLAKSSYLKWEEAKVVLISSSALWVNRWKDTLKSLLMSIPTVQKRVEKNTSPSESPSQY